MSVIPNLNGIKKGTNIIYEGAPYVVSEAHFVRMQMRKPVMQPKPAPIQTKTEEEEIEIPAFIRKKMM